MELQVLGAHQVENARAKATAFVIDRRIAIEAGGLARGLSLAEQQALKAVLITHCHHDHVRDLPTIGLNRWGLEVLPVFALDVVRAALKQHLFNGVIWPDLEIMPSASRPALQFKPAEPLTELEIDGYHVRAIPVRHTVPCVGFFVERDGRSLFYTGDTGGGLRDVWSLVKVDLLLCEVTFPSRLDDIAEAAQHMTPARLRRELLEYRAIHGVLPRIVGVHLGYQNRDEIAEELRLLGQELDSPVEAAIDGQRLEV